MFYCSVHFNHENTLAKMIHCIKCEDLLLNCANVILSGILSLCLPGHLCRSCTIEFSIFNIVVSSTFHRKTVLLNAQTVQNTNKRKRELWTKPGEQKLIVC